MRVGGAYCILVTGGFVSFAEPIAKMLGFNAIRANRLLFDGRQLTGSVEDPIVDAQAKREALMEARDELTLKRDEVLAIGDGANDKMMIQEAGLGVAYRAKPALVEVADARLDHHGLDALLWAQGIRKRDWVTG
jgi:phosphoserine phosphatase